METSNSSVTVTSADPDPEIAMEQVCCAIPNDFTLPDPINLKMLLSVVPVRLMFPDPEIRPSTHSASTSAKIRPDPEMLRSRRLALMGLTVWISPEPVKARRVISGKVLSRAHCGMWMFAPHILTIC